MKIIKLTFLDDKEVFINSDHIEQFEPRKNSTRIYGPSYSAVPGETIYASWDVKEQPDDIMKTINRKDKP